MPSITSTASAVTTPRPPAAWTGTALGLRVSRDREFSAPIFQGGPIVPLAARDLDGALAEARTALWPAGTARDAASGAALLRARSDGPYFATAVVERSLGDRTFPATMRANDPMFEWWIGFNTPSAHDPVAALFNRTEVVAMPAR